TLSNCRWSLLHRRRVADIPWVCPHGARGLLGVVPACWRGRLILSELRIRRLQAAGLCGGLVSGWALFSRLLAASQEWILRSIRRRLRWTSARLLGRELFEVGANLLRRVAGM